MDFYSTLTHIDPSEVEAIEAEQNGESVHALVLNTSKMSDERFLSRFNKVEKHPFIPHVYYYQKEIYDFGKSFYYDVGAFSIQDPAAMLVPYLLNPQKGDKVLDMCAAPGGKSIFASLMMENTGVILSNDISYPRAKAMSQNVERMGLSNIMVTCGQIKDNARLYHHYFDKIILDAPCSGSAMFRKDDFARQSWSSKKVLECAAIQAELIETAYECLMPGGILAYSTCSFSKEENEDILEIFLLAHKDMHLVDISHVPGCYPSKTFKEAIYLFPHRYAGEGQFIALLKKDDDLCETHGEPKNKKNTTFNPEMKSFFQTWCQNTQNISLIGNHAYYLGSNLDHGKLSLLRKGIDLCEYDKRLEPSHHFARCMPLEKCIVLNKSQAEAYLRGESFTLEKENGYHVVAYDGFALGWVKIVNHVCKNHYPKGLRYDYRNAAIPLF